MTITGKNILGFNLSAKGSNQFFAINPSTQKRLNTEHYEATLEEVGQAVLFNI